MKILASESKVKICPVASHIMSAPRRLRPNSRPTCLLDYMQPAVDDSSRLSKSTKKELDL